MIHEQEQDEDDKFMPKYLCFQLNPRDIVDDYRLSVEWNKQTTTEDVLVRVGTSFHLDKHGKRTNDFKPYENRVLYKLEISFLQSLSLVKDVIYKPSKNNSAHSSVCYDKEKYEDREDRVELLIEIRDHAKQFTVNVDMETVKREVEEKRKQIRESAV